MAPLFLLALLGQPVAPPTAGLAPPAGDDPAGARLGFDDPPTGMIDFLGRRMRCAQPGGEGAERARLRCAALAGEELALRRRFAGNAAALRRLDQAPRLFRLEPRFVVTFDGPAPARPRRTEQSGTDADGRPYRLTIDTGADGGRSTRIAAAYNGWPERSFTLSNRMFPLIDLQSLEVGVQALRRDRSLRVKLRYGHPRGYCGEMGDDREQVNIGFGRTRVAGYATRRTNCQRVYTNIGSAPPPL